VFTEWRKFYNELLLTCLEVNDVCAGLLSNNRVGGEGEELVDCRGHPIPQKKDKPVNELVEE
jgi:hypothetical protein